MSFHELRDLSLLLSEVIAIKMIESKKICVLVDVLKQRWLNVCLIICTLEQHWLAFLVLLLLLLSHPILMVIFPDTSMIVYLFSAKRNSFES